MISATRLVQTALKLGIPLLSSCVIALMAYESGEDYRLQEQEKRQRKEDKSGTCRNLANSYKELYRHYQNLLNGWDSFSEVQRAEYRETLRSLKETMQDIRVAQSSLHCPSD